MTIIERDTPIVHNAQIERDIQIVREMSKQGVSSLRLRGPIGYALRVEALPHLKALAKKGAIAPVIFGIIYGAGRS